MPSFAHGIASFDPTDTSVLLWTRVEHAGPLTWTLATDATLDHVVASGEVVATDDDDRCVAVDVDGLEAGTTYFYAFATTDPDPERSPVGRTRTLPGPGAGRLRLGVTCCADDSAAPLGVYRAVAEREVDLVLHLGDYIYEAPTSRTGRHRDLEGAAVTLDDYRQRYATLRADPDLQHLHARHPMVTIWDDHDFADNAWRTGAKAHEEPGAEGPGHGDWEVRARAAIRARREWLPIRPRPDAAPDSIWRSLRVDGLAELVLLDTRFEGRDRQAGDPGTLPRHHPDRSLLGDDQRRWLTDRLADVARPWSLVASGVVVNEMQLPIPGGRHLPAGLLPNGYAVLDGALVHDDQWDGYVAERERLAAAASARVDAGGRTVILSGDVHSCWAIEGPDHDGSPVAVEAVCPAVSSAAMGRANVAGANRLLDRAVGNMAQVRWANVTERGYVVADVTHDRVRVEWWIVDPYADEPAGDAACAHAAELRRGDDPGRWRDVEGAVTVDPDRLPLPVVPDRPSGLRTVRAKRFARIWGKGVAAASVVVLPLVVGVRRALR